MKTRSPMDRQCTAKSKQSGGRKPKVVATGPKLEIVYRALEWFRPYERNVARWQKLTGRKAVLEARS